MRRAGVEEGRWSKKKTKETTRRGGGTGRREGGEKEKICRLKTETRGKGRVRAV